MNFDVTSYQLSHCDNRDAQVRDGSTKDFKMTEVTELYRMLAS